MARTIPSVSTTKKTVGEVVTAERKAKGLTLRELAAISVEDARTLRIIPWDASITKAIEKGITDANLGIGVATDDQGLRVSFPELSSERRVQLTKIAGDKTEQARVTLRGHRGDSIKDIENIEGCL